MEFTKSDGFVVGIRYKKIGYRRHWRSGRPITDDPTIEKWDAGATLLGDENDPDAVVELPFDSEL
jgi:hypothetical protein